MNPWKGIAPSLVLVGMVAAGCATPASQSSVGGGDAQQTAPRRIAAAILGELVGLGPAEQETPPGLVELELLMDSGLTVLDNRGVRFPLLAEAVPSVENGLWRVLPDGGMETTWHLRSDVRWHDGMPFTANDLVFTALMEQDNDTDVKANPVYASISRVEAVGPYTIRVTWSTIYLYADGMFAVGGQGNSQVARPRPKHLLEKAYAENKTNMTTLPFWNQEFVGTGPYKLREWVTGSHVLLAANDRYVLGRPKIDEIEVKFLRDPNTIVAGFLAGTLDVTITRGLSLDLGLVLRDQWSDGQVILSPANPIVMFPQLLPPAPPAMGDVRFRRALLYAADRQALVDSIEHGLSTVAHAPYLIPDSEEYAAVQGSIVRYDYDPRRAAQLMEEMGLTKGPDGFLRDGSSLKPIVEIDTTDSNVTQPQVMLAIADYWQRAGISTNPVAMSTTQLLRNREFLATRPAFYLARRLIPVDSWHSSVIPLPENGYSGTDNYSRYGNPELDALIERYRVTIPQAEHLQLTGRIVHHLTDQVVLFGTIYDVSVTAAAKGLKNVTGRSTVQGETWNAHEWNTA